MWVSHIKLLGKSCIVLIFYQFQSISSELAGISLYVNSKVITCIVFMQYLLVYLSEKLWGFQAMCNPHHNYMHITGYPVQHGDSLHFLWGKHLQCIVFISESRLWLILWLALCAPPMLLLCLWLRLVLLLGQSLKYF